MANVFFTHRVSSASSNSMEIWYNSVREILKNGDNTNWTLLNKKKKGYTDELIVIITLVLACYYKSYN